jgi:uncharacterized protein (DUF1800 family)
VLHLLRRATYGATPALIAEVRAKGTTAWLDEQLAASKVPDTAMDAILRKHFPRLNWTIREVWDTTEFTNYSWDVEQDVLMASIARALWSKRQLKEVMVDFWSNHLNVTNPSDGVWDNRHLYDRDVIRKYALGSFKDMLIASAKHPAMLNYLNQALSTKDTPNENYGREVLELHTVGIDAGYTEADVLASAKILTGLTLANPHPTAQQPDWTRQEYAYDPSIHWVGKLTVHTSASHFVTSNPHANGEPVVDAYLTYLARHPATAQRLALKLCTHFVSDNPPDSLVERMAKVYTAHDTAIAPMLRTMFTSREFALSVEHKVRRPYEDIIASLRTLGVTQSTLPDVPKVADDPSWSDGLQAIYYQVYGMGHAPMNWPQPNGYPDVATAWQSASGVLGRWSTHFDHVAGWWPAYSQKVLTLPANPVNATKYPYHNSPMRYLLPVKLPTTWGAYVDALAARLLHQTLRPEDRATILRFMGKPSAGKIDAALTAQNDGFFSWNMPGVVALLLDTPYHEMA